MLMDKVEEVRAEVNSVKQVLGEDSQTIWCILYVPWPRSWIATSPSYPSDMLVPAMEMDSILWDLLQHCTRLHIPKGDKSLGAECVLPGVTNLQGRSFQQGWFTSQSKWVGLASIHRARPVQLPS